MAKKVSKLPKVVYVKWEDDTAAGTHYLVADETIASMNHGDKVGVYELRETRTMTVTNSLT